MSEGKEKIEDYVDGLGAQLEQLKVQCSKRSDAQVKPSEKTCPVCQDTVVHPISLPCGHTFCYLCLKGVFARNGSCALCRKPIPPDLIAKPESLTESLTDQRGLRTFHWMYEAKSGGWWLYEKRLSDEIEEVFNNKESKFKVQISGFLYIVDFENMVQYRIEKPDRKRKIKREATIEEYKGVAGIPVITDVNKKNQTTL